MDRTREIGKSGTGAIFGSREKPLPSRIFPNRTGRIQCCGLASSIDTLAYLVRRNRAEDARAERDAV